MKRTILCLCLLLAVVSVDAFAEPELKGTPDELANYLKNVPQLATITGESEVRINADQAVVTLLVTVEERSLEKSIEKYQQICATITRRLGEKGIPESQIQPARFITNQEKELFTSKTKSYHVANSIRVTVNNEKQMQSTAQLVDDMDDVGFKEITFKTTREAEYQRQALAKACEDVSAKKQVYEQSLNVRLIPCGFSESITPNPPMPEQSRVYLDKAASAYVTSNVQKYVQFDEVVFTAQVAVHYRLEVK